KGMQLTSLNFIDNQIADLSPLEGMPLTSLNFIDNQIADLSPLEGMPLTSLELINNQIADLSPLKGMQLTALYCWNNQIADLSGLKGMPLTKLNCSLNQIVDLSPLKGMQLTSLNFDDNQIADLSPLKGMPLTELSCSGNQITDLSPLKGTPLSTLAVMGTRLHGANADLVAALPLEDLCFDPELAADSLFDALRAAKGIKSLNWHVSEWFFQLWPDLRTALAGEPVDLRKYATRWRDRMYLCVPLLLPADKAADFCRRQGGHLVCPSSAEELKAVRALALESGQGAALTGGCWDEAAQSYRWGTGEPWNAAWCESLFISRGSFEGRRVLLFLANHGRCFFWVSARPCAFIIEWPADQ
ncbi:leucine-rich repeat domain-containing protein, partial [Verrucomicrobiota bacterium]